MVYCFENSREAFVVWPSEVDFVDLLDVFGLSLAQSGCEGTSPFFHGFGWGSLDMVTDSTLAKTAR